MEKRKYVGLDDQEELLLQYQIQIQEGLNDSKSKYRKLVQAGIAKWVSDFQKGNIQINSVDDLKKLIELDLELQREEVC
ncbi:MAG: hypothetical protein H6Q70_3718 [Firmicutes bacterium]|nr:hypothetical protein [Bacillota bacterium]